MPTMQAILRRLMAAKGWNAYVLADASSVPQPTIHRFLAGTHTEMRGATVKKLAQALEVTEEQLRGLSPLHEAQEEQALVAAYRQLNEIHREALVAVVESFLTAQAKSREKTDGAMTVLTGKTDKGPST